MADPAWPVDARSSEKSITVIQRNKRTHKQVSTATLQSSFWHSWVLWFVTVLTPIIGKRLPRAWQRHESVLSARRALLGQNDPTPLQPEQAPKGKPRAPTVSPRLLRYVNHLVIFVVVLIAIIIPPTTSRFTVQPITTVELARGAGSDIDPQVFRVMAVQSFAADATDLLEQRDTSILNAVFVDEHQIQEGERLQDVAAQYGISVATLFWTNQLGTSEVLAAGRMLKIANREGVVHQVGEGETVATIAAQYQVPTDAIRLFEANGLLGDAEPTVGQELFIPSGVAEYPAEVLSRVGANGVASWMAVSAATVREDQTNLREGPSRMHNRVGKLRAGRALELLARSENWAKVRSGETEGWVRQDLLILPVGAFERLPETTDYPPPPPIWVWPARGVLTSPFGWRSIPFRSFHNGIDIANGAWTPILAARAGVIIEAGWCRGYGYCVRMNHGEGTTTTYGHLIAQPPVRVGEQVEVGEVIGYMGSTYDRAGGGYSTGVHLHFTIMVNGQAVDPLRFLP